MTEHSPPTTFKPAVAETVPTDAPQTSGDNDRSAQRSLNGQHKPTPQWYESPPQNDRLHPDPKPNKIAAALLAGMTLVSAVVGHFPDSNLRRSEVSEHASAAPEHSYNKAQLLTKIGNFATTTTQKVEIRPAPPPTVTAPKPKVQKLSPAPKSPAPAPQTAYASYTGPANIEAIAGEIHGASELTIEQVVRVLLEKHKLSILGAAALTGNFLQESGLRPEAGENGPFRGIAQWSGGRSVGMPADLLGQIDFAIMEMQRDGDGARYNVLGTLRSSNVPMSSMQLALKRWERYGKKGNREIYGQMIFDFLTTPFPSKQQ